MGSHRLFQYVLVILCLTLATAGASADLPLDVIAKNPEAYLHVPVQVQGSVIFTGKNYYSDSEPKFVLRNSAGTEISVRPWLPIELMIPPPSATDANAPRPRTMKDVLGKTVRLRGTIAQDARTNRYEIQVDAAEYPDAP